MSTLVIGILALRLRSTFLVVLLCLLVALPQARAGRIITDSAGRQVEIPDRVERIMAAGPPASALVTMLAPEKLIGWNRKPSPDELAYLPPTVAHLPEIGRLTGRGGTANLEVVLAARPDVIVDFGAVNDTYISLANRVQSQTGIPYVLIDGRFGNTVQAIRLLGTIFGTDTRAEQLAMRTEAILREVDQAVAAAAPGRRPRVYLARGPRGLETGSEGSIHTEIIERAGGINVAAAGLGPGNLHNVSLEQVLAWNPDTIIALDATVFASMHTTSGWSTTDALRRKRVFLSPNLPYGWVDAPPSVNRLIGLQWLARLFFPERFPDDVRTATRDFYKLFHQVDLSDGQIDRLLGNGGKPR